MMLIGKNSHCLASRVIQSTLKYVKQTVSFQFFTLKKIFELMSIETITIQVMQFLLKCSSFSLIVGTKIFTKSDVVISKF